MKIAHFNHREAAHWGIVDVAARTVTPVDGTILDWGPDLTSGHTAPRPSGDPVSFDAVEWLTPLEPTSTIVGVGMNYWTHLEKLGVTERPESTVGYLKARASMVPHQGEIQAQFAQKLDFEVELVAVIGSVDARDEHPRTNAVLGYTVGNDVSAREFIEGPMGGPDLFSMKALDRSTPLGPWITTKDELGGAGQLDLEIVLRVNGEQRQHDRTSKMIFSLDECLDYVLDRLPLTTGDVVFTGTTDGCGAEDGRYLQAGDVVEAEVEGIGILRNVVAKRT